MHENWSTCEAMADTITLLIRPFHDHAGSRRDSRETGVVADTGAGHQKLMKLLESEMSV